MIDRDLYDNIISEYLQYPDNLNDSLLWKSIKQVQNCTDDEAIDRAHVHCNSLSFYALCRARGFIEFHYTTWLEKLLRVRYISEIGFLNADKKKIAELFGFEKLYPPNKKIEYISNYDKAMSISGEDYGYNIKVYNNSGKGDHFMGGYALDGVLYISDSSKRGIRVKAAEVISRNKFQWLSPV